MIGADGQRKPRFLSLKWKALLGVSLVLAVFNASLAILVYNKTARQFDTEQSQRRLAQSLAFETMLSNGFESMSTFAAFIPLLSAPGHPVGSALSGERIEAILREHGAMLAVEWGIESVHYFASGRLDRPVVSWPESSPADRFAGLLDKAHRADSLGGVISCSAACSQVIALPLLDNGATAGFLVVRRSLADVLREFHLLTGAETVILGATGSLVESDPGRMSGERYLAPWRRPVLAVTHRQDVLPITRALAESYPPEALESAVQRVKYASEWYEFFVLPASAAHPELSLLGVNRVTAQVHAIHDATIDSLLLGLAGLVLSELMLLGLMWRPMQRIQDVVFALPLLVERAYSRLRHELPSLPVKRLASDEIDVMINVIGRVSMDIEQIDTARTLAETALRENQRSLELAQSMAHVAAWQGRPLSGEFEINEGAERIHPCLGSIRIWEDFVALVHPGDRSRLRIDWRTSRPGTTMDSEFRLRIDEAEIHVHAIAAFDEIGPDRVLKATGMMQDVTELRFAERTLKGHRNRLEEEVLLRTAELVSARNEAERLAGAKGRFLATMSHEIRTPMNAVMGLAQIGMEQSENRAIARTFKQILDAGGHLLNVVNDVLDFSKIEAGKLAIEARPFDLRETVLQCFEMLEQAALQKRLKMQINVADDVSGRVVGDSFRLLQILVNLVGNAIKFTKHGTVSLDVYREEGNYSFKIVDSGIGMTREQVGRLFVPYQQVALDPEQRVEGTGLGLTISNTLAVMMGGTIEVHSEPGLGSQFVLRLPMAESEADPGPPDIVAADGAFRGGRQQRLAGLRVLVVDDVPINRTILITLLTTEGAEAVGAENGGRVMEVLAADGGECFDVVLMDVEMPGMDGRKATRLLREAGIETPVLGVTAHISSEQYDASIAAGMDDQITKPVMRDQLVGIVLRLVAERHAAPRSATDQRGA
jgi:signal transduction histidine kinase